MITVGMRLSKRGRRRLTRPLLSRWLRVTVRATKKPLFVPRRQRGPTRPQSSSPGWVGRTSGPGAARSALLMSAATSPCALSWAGLAFPSPVEVDVGLAATITATTPPLSVATGLDGHNTHKLAVRTGLAQVIIRWPSCRLVAPSGWATRRTSGSPSVSRYHGLWGTDTIFGAGFILVRSLAGRYKRRQDYTEHTGRLSLLASVCSRT